MEKNRFWYVFHLWNAIIAHNPLNSVGEQRTMPYPDTDYKQLVQTFPQFMSYDWPSLFPNRYTVLSAQVAILTFLRASPIEDNGTYLRVDKHRILFPPLTKSRHTEPLMNLRTFSSVPLQVIMYKYGFVPPSKLATTSISIKIAHNPKITGRYILNLEFYMTMI